MSGLIGTVYLLKSWLSGHLGDPLSATLTGNIIRFFLIYIQSRNPIKQGKLAKSKAESLQIHSDKNLDSECINILKWHNMYKSRLIVEIESSLDM